MNERGPTIAGPVLERLPGMARRDPQITVCSFG